MIDFWDFLLLREPNIKYVLAGMVLLSVSLSLVGTFSFLRKQSLLGDAVAHAILPGICLAFMVSGSKNLFVLMVGAVLAGLVSLLAMNFIKNHSKIKSDAAVGLVMSVFFGFGILLLTYIQQQENASQTGLDKFLFGKSAAIIDDDLWALGIVSVVLIAVIGLCFKAFQVISFDKQFSQAIGLPVGMLEFLLSTITVLAIAVGIQAVGVVLIASLLITPSLSARFWTNNLPKMMALGVVFAIFSSWIGCFISFVSPAMPTGPWIVVVLSGFVFGSMLFAPKNGLISKMMVQHANQDKILQENILKLFYKIGEQHNDFLTHRSKESLMASRSFTDYEWSKGIKKLIQNGSIINQQNGFLLTKQGLAQGKRIVKLHRLWELYLNQKLRMPADHVHNDAESLEHLITPELETLLEKELNFPDKDPHNKQIPY